MSYCATGNTKMLLRTLTEDVEVIVPPQFNVNKQELKSYLSNYHNKPWQDETKFAASRWIYKLRRVNDSYGEERFTFDVLPRINPSGKLPKNGIESIPAIPDMVYRGMSWNEWQQIKSTHKIGSTGSHNIGQDNLTFYGSGDTAEHYSNSFAPYSFKPSVRMPGVVIEIPRKLVMDHSDDKRIPASEFAHSGFLPSSAIQRKWMLVPNRIKPGSLEIIKSNNKISEGSRMSPSVSHQLVEF